MHALRTISLGPHSGREFFATVFVEPDPSEFDSFVMPSDADQWGISVHFQPDNPFDSHVEVARIDTNHGEPHFDHLYEHDQRKEWLGQNYTYAEARRELLSNWRTYADEFLVNHYHEDR